MLSWIKQHTSAGASDYLPIWNYLSLLTSVTVCYRYLLLHITQNQNVIINFSVGSCEQNLVFVTELGLLIPICRQNFSSISRVSVMISCLISQFTLNNGNQSHLLAHAIAKTILVFKEVYLNLRTPITFFFYFAIFDLQLSIYHKNTEFSKFIVFSCSIIEFLQLSGNFPHTANCIEQTWDFPDGVQTECGSAPVRIFKSDVFSMVNDKFLTAQCALLWRGYDIDVAKLVRACLAFWVNQITYAAITLYTHGHSLQP